MGSSQGKIIEREKDGKYEREKKAMSKRPPVDLSALTSEAAAPMQEAVQRAPRPALPTAAGAPVRTRAEDTKTANLQALAFKVPPAFRKRFRQRAADADLKLNELLFAALDAWEDRHNLKR
jgi:hypothetical protein